MCPPAPVSPPADIPLCWTDEELCMFLEKITPGSPLPRNVLDESPYNYSPSNLPENVWYLIRSKEKDDSDHGFWKAKGEACEIFTNSSITGWRTTLEFCEGQAPCEHKTDWVMQEYKITWKGQCKNSKPKFGWNLCRNRGHCVESFVMDIIQTMKCIINRLQQMELREILSTQKTQFQLHIKHLAKVL